MSKIGNAPIAIQNGVQVQFQDGIVTVTGKDGTLTVAIPRQFEVVIQDTVLNLKRKNDTKHVKSMHGLLRSLINNAVIGVNTPWEKKLDIVGTGYRVKMQGEDLFIEVGFSHPVIFKKTEGITLSVDGTNKIIIKGIDKQLVGQVAYQIKVIKKPDPYKGKGIRYQGEQIKLKAGKKAKTAGAK